MANNYYLSLLKTKVEELKITLEDIKNNDYSDEYKKYLLAGHIITLDSILEIGISDLHSDDFDKLTALIYYTRQKIIHYGYFNGMHNMEQIATDIVTLTDKFQESEQEYLKQLFDPKNFELKGNNVLVKASSNIISDGIYCSFKSKRTNQELLVPLNKIFTLTKKSKEKAAHYIVDLSAKCSLLTDDPENNISGYKEITGLELKTFLKNNFIVEQENYNKHNEVIRGIIEKFIQKPVQSSQIMEYASDEQFCRNTIDVIKEFMLEHCLFEAYIQHYYLIKDKYSLNKMHKTDYTKLQKDFKKNILQYMTQKDAFFVEMTIKRTKYFFENLRLVDQTFDVDSKTLAPILVQLFETGPKYFSKQFISSSPEFKKCFSNLLRYRQIFSHYLLNNKEYDEALEKFRNEFLSFIKILQTVNLDDVRIPVHEELEPYYMIEKDKDAFFNYKHEQFLEISKNLYIGKKIHYSSRNAKSDKLIAIIPGGNQFHLTTCFCKDCYGDIFPLYEIDHITGAKQQLFMDSTNRFINKEGTELKEIKADFNLANLFTAYSALRKLKNNGEIQIHFLASEANDNYDHYDDLENIIIRFYAQGYIPIELLTSTTLDMTKLQNGILYLKDENGNVIANIINTKKYQLDSNTPKDEKRFFSRIDDISHSFSRRRHSK